MDEALQTANTQAMLLSNPDLLSLKKATTFLVGRTRLRTPSGASEFLRMALTGHREAFEARAQMAHTVCELYRDFFPREYMASESPLYSTAREQAFYGLVEQRMFPIGCHEAPADPEFFWPCI